MVQRKVPNKLGIQADQVKSNKLLVNLKPSSSLQHQESKNRGPELKKKMKKSRPAKRPENMCLGSSNFIRQVPQPGKPPPAPVFQSPQKKSPIKTSEATTPNYMKSTTSSDARKELSLVSSRNLQALLDSKISSTKKGSSSSSKVCSTSDHKPSRTLARTSSLKLVRTLTKTTSFKPARSSGKKCSSLVLSENINVQRATCSSTLKDSKFPDYLTLNSGGTEAVGTSTMKVCPYTYCSLNGHHHSPLPPLKCFLSAKRRLLKTQRTLKLGCLSPRRSKPNKDLIGGIERFANEVLNKTAISPVIQEEHDDFFVQIYSNEMEAAGDINATVKCKVNDQLNSDASLNYITPPVRVRDEIVAEPKDRQALGDLLDDQLNSEFSAKDNHNGEEIGEAYRSSLEMEKSQLECLSKCQDVEERTESIDDPEFEPSDMDWETGENSTLYLDDEVENSLQTSQDSDWVGTSVVYDSFIIFDESIFKSDEIATRNFEEIQAGQVQGKSFDEESISSSAGSNQDCEMDEHTREPNPNPLEASITIDEKGNNDKMVDEYKASEVDNETTEINREVNDKSVDLLQTEDAALIDYSENDFEQDDYAAEQTWELDFQDSETVKECIKNHDLFATDSALGVEEKEQVDPVKALIRTEIVISLQGSYQPVKDNSNEDRDQNQLKVIEEDESSNQTLAEDLPDGTRGHSPEENSSSGGIENSSEKNEVAARSFECSDSEDQPDSRMKGFSLANDAYLNSCITEIKTKTDFGQETIPASNNTSSIRKKAGLVRRSSDQEVPETCKTRNWTKGCKRSIEEDEEEPNEFNPRAPNFLPVEPDQESEKVDLKHQNMDERKNSDEWMLDYALQQAVTKLAPARRRKVALLVEAFEAVMPVTKCDTQLRHTSVAFAHAPPMQACN